MVSGKAKTAMGFHQSPGTDRQKNSTPSKQPSKLVFPRFHFHRSSAQVQPRPVDVSELLSLVEQLQTRESLLKTELLEAKLRNECSVTMEREISAKNDALRKAATTIERLEIECQALGNEAQKVKDENQELKIKMQEMEAEILELKKAAKEGEDEEATCFPSLGSSNFRTNLNKENGISDFAENQEPEVFETSSMKCEDDNRNVRFRSPRVPKPPPKRKDAVSQSPTPSATVSRAAPPPPPPPPPQSGNRFGPVNVRRVPELVDFYHSLMRRDSRKENGLGTPEVVPAISTRDMIGEIENRSAHLLAIKTDVETQGDFIRFLIQEIGAAAFSDIEEVVSFVKWLDDELSFLVDERAVLKHFDWPEKKADALREAAFGYSDLKKLVTEARSLCNASHQSCRYALKKFQALLEKLEHGVYSTSRMREASASRYKSFQIPTEWMLETGIVNQIKLASMKLAMKYMKMVSAELENGVSSSEEEELLVQGVRFAFRVHQFAGGVDSETMRAFQELRDKAKVCHIQQCQGNQPPKVICASGSCSP